MTKTYEEIRDEDNYKEISKNDSMVFTVHLTYGQLKELETALEKVKHIPDIDVAIDEAEVIWPE